MGWNPQFSFKLRDDQVAFGNLILDKNGAQFIAEMLIEIKNGAVPDLGLMKSVLDDYCFTDDEFSKLRDEMAEIQEDIKEFKSIGSNTLQKWNVFMQTIAVHTNYAIGSDTWIERYKELKMIAANMFDGILKCGYKFGDERLKQLHERYDEIIGCTNGMERVGNFLQKQYKEAVLNGDENALDNYCNSMVETGVWTKDIADRERKKHEMNNLLNAAEGRKDYEDGLKAKREADASVMVTWDMWKTMCDRVDDLDSKSVAIEDIQKAEQILDYICTIYTSEAGIPLDDMKVAHRSNQLINIGIATVNSTKYRMAKTDYEFIMGLKTRGEAIRESADDGYTTLTQRELINAINAYENIGISVSNEVMREARIALCDIYNELNNELDIVSIGRKYTQAQDFMILMKTAIMQPQTGTILDQAVVQYPTKKLNKFYSYCSGSSDMNTKPVENGMDTQTAKSNINLSMEQAMLLEQTSGNIDVDTICAMIDSGRLVLNKSTLKIVYERINNWLNTYCDCSIELVTSLYNIVSTYIMNYKSCMQVNFLPKNIETVVEKLMDNMDSNKKWDSVNCMNDVICLFLNEQDVPDTYVRVYYWNTVIAETYIEKEGSVECMDFRILLQNMTSSWSGNYTWCVNMQKAMFNYVTNIDRYTAQSSKLVINEAMAMIGDFLKAEEVSFEQDKQKLEDIVKSLESMNEVRHIKIAIDPEVYKSIFFYMNSGKTQLMRASLDAISDEIVPVDRYWMSAIEKSIPENFGLEYKNKLAELLKLWIEPVANNLEVANYVRWVNELAKSTASSFQYEYMSSWISEVISQYGNNDEYVRIPKSLHAYMSTAGTSESSNISFDITAQKTKEVLSKDYHADESETVSIKQDDVYNLGASLPTAIGYEYKNTICVVLLMYLKGLQNWAPAQAWEQAQVWIQRLEQLLSNTEPIYRSESIGEFTRGITDIHNIYAIEVNVPKALIDYLQTAIFTDDAKSILKKLVDEYSGKSMEVSDITKQATVSDSREKTYQVYEDYIHAIVEMDATEIPIDCINYVGLLMADIVDGVKSAWFSNGLKEEHEAMCKELNTVKSNLSPMLFEDAWASAKSIAKYIINHTNIYPDVYTSREVFTGVFQEG